MLQDHSHSSKRIPHSTMGPNWPSWPTHDPNWTSVTHLATTSSLLSPIHVTNQFVVAHISHIYVYPHYQPLVAPLPPPKHHPATIGIDMFSATTLADLCHCQPLVAPPNHHSATIGINIFSATALVDLCFMTSVMLSLFLNFSLSKKKMIFGLEFKYFGLLYFFLEQRK